MKALRAAGVWLLPLGALSQVFGDTEQAQSIFLLAIAILLTVLTLREEHPDHD